MDKMIYMDNAATTKMTPAVIQAMCLCMENTWYNPSSLYAPAQRAAEALRDARVRIAACLNAFPDEIIFTSGGSESDNQAILSATRAGAQAGKRHIISTAIEHHAVLNGSLENRLPGNVNFSFAGLEGESLVLLLNQQGICASAGSACTSHSLAPSHVLLAIGRTDDEALGALRLSLDTDNTQADVDEVLRAVPELVKGLRRNRGGVV